jgi:hypothetical protein
MKKNINIILTVFTLLSLLLLPYASFATSFSDIQHGNEDNTLKMSIDSYVRRSDLGYDPINGREEHTDRHGHGGRNSSPTPVPSAVWLFGSGLVGLIGIKRKLQK